MTASLTGLLVLTFGGAFTLAILLTPLVLRLAPMIGSRSLGVRFLLGSLTATRRGLGRPSRARQTRSER